MINRYYEKATDFESIQYHPEQALRLLILPIYALNFHLVETYKVLRLTSFMISFAISVHQSTCPQTTTRKRVEIAAAKHLFTVRRAENVVSRRDDRQAIINLRFPNGFSCASQTSGLTSPEIGSPCSHRQTIRQTFLTSRRLRVNNKFVQRMVSIVCGIGIISRKKKGLRSTLRRLSLETFFL